MCLFKENFLTLWSHTRQCLTQWSPLSTSLVGQINSIKINILPKLNVFQSVPTFIPKSFFDTLDSVISSYIWKGKCPRLNKAHLQRPEGEGGMALPNFRFFYWAANIRCLLFWSYFHNRSDCPSWVAMELGPAKNFSIPPLVGSSLPLPPVVRHTLRMWAQFRRHFGLSDFWLSSPISANHLFQPSLLDPTFQEWRGLGIGHFRDLFIGNSFASFEQLTEKYNLPKTFSGTYR